MEDSSRKKLYDKLSESYNLGTFEEFDSKMGNDSSRRALYDKVTEKYNIGTFEEFNTKMGNTHRQNLEAFNTEHGAFMNDFEARDTAESKMSRAGLSSGIFVPSEGSITGEERQRYLELHKQEEALKRAWYNSPDYLAQKDADALFLSQMRDGIQRARRDYSAANPTQEIAGAEFVPVGAAVRRTRGEADKEMQMFDTASRIMDDVVKLHNAPSKYDGKNVFLKFGKGVGDTLSDVDFWSSGLTEIADNFGVREVLDSVQSKLGNLNDLSEEAIEDILSPAEKAVLQAWALNAQEQANRKDDLARAYQAGQSATESLGYMAEFALTGGIGEATSKGVGAMTKWLGKKVLGQMDDAAAATIRETGEKIAKSTVGKYGARLADALAETAGKTLVMPSTFRNISEKAAEIQEDAEGNRYLTRMNDAFAKGFTDSFIENLSEGGRVNALGDLIGDVAGKIPAYKKIVDKFANSKAGELLTAFNSSGIMNTLRAGGWHGFGEEYLEEWYGNALRTLTGLDKEALKDFATVDNQIITVTSFLPMTIFGGTVSTAQVLSAKKGLDKKAEMLRSALLERGYDEKQADNMIDMMRGASPAEVSQTLTPIVNAVALRDLNEAAVLMKPVGEFAEAVRRWQSFDTKYQYQEQEQRDNLRTQMEETLGQFWQEDENGRQTVQRGVNEKGEVVYLLGKPTAEEAQSGIPQQVAAITSDGRKVFVDPSAVQLEEELEMNDFLGTEIMAEKGNKEQARMIEEKERALAQVRQMSAPGTTINLGTTEAPVVGTVTQRTPDGVVITMQDGTARQVSYEELGNYVGVNTTPLTDAQMEERDADALTAERAQREAELDMEYDNLDASQAELEDAESEVEQAVEAATPLPTKADGSVDQTALWNEDPARWAQWNDEQRQDDGAHTASFLLKNIQKLRNDIMALNAEREANLDPEAEAQYDAQIATARDRMEALVNVFEKYVPSDIAQQMILGEQTMPTQTGTAPASTSEQVAPRISSQMGEQVDEQYDGILRQTRIKEERVRILQEYLDKISEGSLQAFVLTSDNYADVMRREGCSEGVIAVVGMHLEAGENIGGFTSKGKLFLMEDGLPSIEEARITYIHERQHVFNTNNPVFVKAIASMADKQMLLSWLSTFVGQRGLNPYRSLSVEQLADEVVARCMEIAYTTEDFSVDLQSRGIPSEVISIITEIDNEQRQDQSLSHARRRSGRNSHADISGAGSVRQDGRNIEQVSGGVLEQEAARPSGIGEEGISPRSTGEGSEPAEVDPEALLNEDGFEVDEQNEDARFSVRYLPTPDQREGIIDSIVAVTGRTREDAERWLESELSLASIVLTDQEYLDYAPDAKYKAIKDNSDYPQGTVDFNNICRKRKDFTRMYTRLQRAYPNRIFTAEDLADIRTIMSEDGLTVACGLCYVEDRRQKLGEVANAFIEDLQDGFRNYAKKGATKKANAVQFTILVSGDTYIPSIYDLITLEGSDKLYEEHRGIWEAFGAYNRARGQQTQNTFQGYAEYKREILTWSDAKVKKVNSLGGLRIFSYSDFEAHHLLDIIQIIIDCAARGVMIQGYTKVPEFARVVEKTGIKLNRSLIPLGDTGIVDGKLAYDPVEGIDINDPNFLESNDNVGNILIGINDEQIRMAMADPFIHFIIPYHARQAGNIRAKLNVGAWTNYIDTQNERKMSDGKRVEKNINIYTDVLNESITNDREFVEKYLEVCRQKEYIPKFDQFLDKDAEGNYVYTPGYYKFLVDFKLFDEAGNILPQKAVVADFDDAFNAQVLNDYAREERETAGEAMNATYDKIVETLDLGEPTEGKDVQFRTSEGPVDILEEATNAVVNDVAFRFIGEQAAVRLDNAVNATMFMDNLQTAREMEQDLNPDWTEKGNTAARKIKMATGWEKGADGMWRHEMPDFEIKAKQGKKKTFKLPDLITDSSLFTEYPQLKDVKVRYKKMSSGLMGQVVTENGQTYINMNDIQYQALNPRYVEAIDKFSQKYPELAEKIGKGGGRNITAEEKQIFIEEVGDILLKEGPYLDIIGGLKTLAHEVQHLIQEYEGFAEGGNSEMIDTRDPLVAKENIALLKLISAEIDAANAMVPELNDLVNQIRQLRAQMTINVRLQNEYDQKRKEFLTHKANVAFFKNQRAKLRRIGSEGYNSLAGEVEARNVEARINMTDAQRRESIIADTQDVDTKDQIFLRDNLMTDYAESQINFRITPEQDKAYMDAVKAGDMETVAKMVAEAAKLAMPNTTVVDENGYPREVYRVDEYRGNRNKYTNVYGGVFYADTEEYFDHSDTGYKKENAEPFYINTEGFFDPMSEMTELMVNSWADILGKKSEFEKYDIEDESDTDRGFYNDGEEVMTTSTDGLALAAQRMGYKGVILRDIPQRNGNDFTEYAVFNSNAIKSAKLVTYDDQGNVIPLSERFNEENDDIRFRVRSEEQREKLFADAKEKYGVTDNFNAAGYMLPDGSLLDFSEANDGGDPNSRSLDHRDIEGVIMDNGAEYDSRWMYVADFMNEGAIRLLPESAGINMIQAPTEEQRKKIFDFIYKYNGEVILEINDERLNSIAYMEYDRRTSPSRIFRDIDGYFNDGIVPQQDVRFRMSNENQAIFVSNAAKAVEGIKQEKATPEQWLKMIEKAGGLKAGEDKWMGLSDWLKASDKKTLTKAEVLDFINENMIVIEEQHYSDEEVAASANKLLNEKYPGWDEAFSMDWDSYMDEPYASIWDTEIAVDLYNQNHEYSIELDEDGEFQYMEDEENVTAFGKDLAEIFYRGNSDVRPIHGIRSEYQTRGLSNNHEIALTVPDIERWKADDAVHFGDAGDGRAIAWIRFGETWEQRPSPQISRKVLVIDEIQSNRHQEGRKRGYKDIRDIRAIKQRKAEIEAEIESLAGAVLEGDRKAKRQQDALFREHRELSMQSVRGEIPDAPFEKNWAELAMKRMLRYAAENGFDVIAWTTGDQQANRYDLSRDVKKISVYPSKDGSRNVNIHLFDRENDFKNLVVDSEGIVTFGEYKGRALADVVGKETALKIMGATRSTEFAGDNLKVGGEGMRGFYDKMLPAFMNKYGKKWGVKVEDIDLPNLGKFGYTMHSVPVTEEMKASVMEGQVMFRTTEITPEVRDEMDVISATALINGTYMQAPNGKPTNLTAEQWAMVRTKNFKKWFGDWENDPENASKVVDENGEPKVVYHGRGREFNVFEHQDYAYENASGKGFYFTDDPRAAKLYTMSGFMDNQDKMQEALYGILYSEYNIDSDEAWELASEYIDRGEADFEQIDEAYNKAIKMMFPNPNVLPVFLNMRRPYDIVKENAERDSWVINNEIEKNNLDGVIDEGFSEAYKTLFSNLSPEYQTSEKFAQYMVVNAYQIKSAIDNTGEFSEGEGDIRYRIRTKPAPKKTGIGYKVFYLKDGKLYPPMVANQGGVDTPVGVWLDAEEGTRAGESKTGRPKVKQGGRGTQGGSGTLAYRPGWHLGEIPYAIQFNRKDENGDRTLFPADFVWAEVEYANDVDYQDEAMSYGMNANGKFQHSLAGLPKLPTDGSYRYRTNPNPETDPWIITGAMKVNRLLTPSEVDQMVIDAGREPQRRQEGAVNDEQIEALNKELGLVEEEVSFRVNENPTEAQKEAGNYKMGHLNLDGYRITIENPKGSVRRGTDSKGNAWENTLNNDYGYIRGTEGVDGDHIDVYLSDNPSEGNVFVIDQVNPQTREFDEHKVMYGFNSAEEAREAYLANFSEGWNGLGTITEVSKDEFKKWIESSHRKTKPFSEYKSVKAIGAQSEGEEIEDYLLPSPGTPTDEVVANGLDLTPAQLSSLAGDIFTSLPEESRKKITEGLDNVFGLQDAILQIPTSLAMKEKWSDEDKAVADTIAEELTKMAGEMTRPFSASEGLWVLYNALNPTSEYDILSQASRAIVQRNLGFDAETLRTEEEAKDGVRFRTVGDASANARASLYNRGAVNVWTRLKESFVDMNASVEELVKAIEKASGKVAEGFENILMALNQQSSKGLAAMESYTQRFLNPMFDAIREIMDATDFRYEDITRYVILKHGLERNEKMAQRNAREFYRAEYEQKVASINADQSLSDAQKQALIAAAQQELDSHLTDIDMKMDAKFMEFRERDYSGISSMFYDTLGVSRKDYETEEEYQAAVMQAKQDKYATLADIEAAAMREVANFEMLTNTDNLWDRINKATKETLRQQYEANMISKDQYETLRDMYQFYVPLRGFADNTAEDMYTYYRRPNSSGYTKPIIGAEGRKTEAESPFGWIAAMAGSAIASNVKNEAKLALYYFVANRPDNGIATLSRTWYEFSHTDPATGKKVFKPAYPPFTEDLSSDAAKAAYEQWQEDMRQKRAAGLAYESGQRLNLGNAVVNISDTNKPEHIVNVKIGGKDYTIIINGNPRAAQAINGDLNIESSSQDYSSLFGPVLRWMSSVNTSYNPEFWITNMMRDMAFTWMAVNTKEDPAYRRRFAENYRKAFKVISLVAKNEKGTLGNTYLEQMYQEFVKYGGVTGYTQIKDNETWEKEIDSYLKSNAPGSLRNGKIMKGAKKFFHGAHRFGESLEQVSRFAAFLTSREMGKSTAEAINDAKEITVNFNRKGSGKMITLEEAKYLTDRNGQPLNKFEQLMAVGLSSIAPLGRRFIMFFNAAIQGLNATYKLWKKNPSRFVGWTLAYTVLGAMNAVVHAMLDDDDDYLDMPQYERRNSLMLGFDGVYIKWALPQEARAFYALGDLAVESIMGRNPQKAYEKGGELGQALSIVSEVLPINPTEGWRALLPSAFIPAAELIVNEDYKGDPIYNEQKWLSKEERSRTAKWSKAYQGTGQLYVSIAKGLNAVTGGDEHDAGLINLQPEKMEHIVQSAFGGTIRTADKFVSTILAAIDPDEDVTIRQFPFLNRILTLNDERFKNVHVNDVFDYYKADAEHALTLEKQYKKNKDIDALDKLRDSDEYQWAKIYNKYKKPISKIQEKIKVADGTAERKELMKQQDELKRKMIKEISELP